MNSIFREDWAKNGIMFNYPENYHWNEYAHSLASREIVRYLMESGLIGEAILD
jgi:hypothetical protein